MILHTLNASPANSSFTDCLNTAAAGDTILLLGDGVYAALPGSAACERLTNSPATVVLLDCDALVCGVGTESFEQVDMNGFVALTEHYPRQLAWY